MKLLLPNKCSQARFIYPIILLFFSLFSYSQFTTVGNTHTLSDLKNVLRSDGFFVQNIGQYGQEMAGQEAMGKILYGYEGMGMPVLFTSKGLIFLQRKIEPLNKRAEEALEKEGINEEEIEKRRTVIDKTIVLEWLGSNPNAIFTVSDQTSSYQTYSMLTQKASGYRTLTCKNLYPGIDLVYQINEQMEQGFEYSLLVHPGANIHQIALKTGGDFKKIAINKTGGLNIQSEIGAVTQRIPLTYYANTVQHNYPTKDRINSAFQNNNGIISFNLPMGYDSSKTIVIDPFVSGTGTLSGINAGKAKDVDFDYAGNIFVSGGGDGSVHKLAKYDANGVLQWTFNGSLTVPAWTFGSYYGGWVVEKNTGNVYLGQGFAPAGGFKIIRLNNAGVFDNYMTTGNPSFLENWKMFWSCNNGSPQILVAGGGTNSNINFGICTPPSTVLGSVNVTGIAYTGTNGWAQDIVDAVIDPANNDLYTIYGSLIGTPSLSNQIYKNTAPYSSTSVAWTVASGYASLQEIANRPYLTAAQMDNAANIFAVNASYLFYWDGRNLKAFNKATGATAGTPLTTANTLLMQGGIIADDCNNIYVGSVNGTIKVYKFNGTIFDDAAAPDITIAGFATSAVYDLVYNDAQKLLYASGNGFVSSIDISSYGCGSTTYSLGVATNCVNLSATATLSPAPPPGSTITYILYVGASQVASNSTGVFTGLQASINYSIHAIINQTCSGTQTIANFIIPAPNLSVSKTDATCGNASGTITATGSGGVAPLQYSIDGTNFQPSGNFTGLAAGVYTVIVKDANGCQNSAVVTIINANGPSLSLAKTDASCGASNGSITVTGTGGLTPYQYSKDGTTYQLSNQFNGLAADIYIITIKDATGCTNSGNITVGNIGTTILSTQTTAASCGNSNGSITTNVTGGTAPYSYSIDAINFQTNNAFTGLASGTYTITVKDANNCTNSIGVAISNQAGPQLTATVTPSSCTGNTGSITANAVGGVAPLQYSKNGGLTYQASNLFPGLASGTYTVMVIDANGCSNSTTVVVSLSVPQVTATTVPATCNVSDGIINAIGTGGTTPYLFSINGTVFQVSNVFSGLASGNYTISIKDANNCNNSAFPIVVGNAAGLIISASSTSTACISNTGTITASATGGVAPLQYSINGTVYQSSGLFTGLGAGNYTVYVKDANGCISQTSIVIITIPKPTVTATSTSTSCNSSNGTITATGSGGTAPYQYSINGTVFQVSNVFGGLTPGPYTVTIRDANGCTGTVFVVVNNVGGGSGPTVTATSLPAECGQSNGKINASASGGQNPTRYSIDGVNYQNSSNFTNLPPGTYTVFARDANGCIATTSVVVDNIAGPQVSAITTASVCGGSTGTIDATGSGGTAPYRFSIDGVNFQGNNNGLFTGLSAGFYTVTVRDADNICRNSIVVYVANSNGPDVTVSSTDAYCVLNNGTITVISSGGTAPFTYSINGVNFQSSNVFSGLAPGQYPVTAKDANGCANATTVTIGIIAVPNVTATTTPEACNSANASIIVTGSNGTAPYQYAINGGAFQSANVFSGLTAGVYSVVLKDDNNCTSTTTVTISAVAGPQLTASATPSNCNGNNGTILITGTAGTMPYQYSINGTVYQSSFYFTGLAPGNYTTYIKDANNCINTVAVQVSVVPGGGSLAGTTGGVQVCATAPVAATGTFYFDASCNLIAKVTPSGTTPVNGSIQSCVIIDGSTQVFNAEPYVQRHFDIEPSVNAANATATITLFFRDQEFVDFNTNSIGFPFLPTVAGGGNSDPNISHVRVTQYHGIPIAPHNVGNPSPGYYTVNGGAGVLITPSVNYNTTNNYWEVSFPITGFSGFYVHTNLAFALPVKLQYFNGSKQSGKHLLNWKLSMNGTATVKMILERSTDAAHYTDLYSTTTDSTRALQAFNFTDAQPLAGINYYRLKIITVDGQFFYSNIVALSNTGKAFDIIGIQPNPVNDGSFVLKTSSTHAVMMEIIINDMQGREIRRQRVGVQAGINAIPMDVRQLTSGTYTIYTAIEKDRSTVLRFLKN